MSKSTISYLLYKLVNRPHLILGLFFLIILGFLVLTPLFEIIKDSLSVQSYDIAYLPDAKIGEFTFFHYERVFAGPLSKALLINPLLNSLLIGICVTFIGVSIGTFLAWLIVRTNIRYKGVFGALAVVPYMMPSWVLALAWLSLFKNDRIGGAEGLFAYFIGIQPPNWVSYGFFPIVVCLALHYYAYGYLLMSGALASVDTELEDAGAISGMNRRQRMLRITIPLLLPALGSAIVLTFIRILGTFGTPALLGLPVRFYTFSTQIYASLNASNNGDAYVLALVLILTAIICIWVNNRILGVRKSFVTLTGKGFRSREIDLGVWRWIATIGVALFLATTVFLPLIILLWESLLIVPGDYNLSNFTFEYWFGDGSIDETYGEPGVFQSGNILNSLWNSIRLGISAALFNGFIGLMVGYAVVRGRGTLLSKWLEGVAFALCDCLEALKKVGPCPDQLLAIGGGSRSRFWLETIATTLNTAIARPIDGEYGAAMGAARLAILGKTNERLKNIVSQPTISEIIEPRTDLTDLYSEAFTTYRSAPAHLKSIQ